LSGETKNPGPPKEQNPMNSQAVAMEMAKAHRALELYPIGHPQLKNIIHNSFQKISAELARSGEVGFTVGRDGIFFQGKPIEAGADVLRQLTTELHIRQVRKFAFRQNLNERELFEFFKMLLLPADDFRAGKKIEEYFRSRQIGTIYVNEVDFGRVFLGKFDPNALLQQGGEAESSEGEVFSQISFLVEALDLCGEDGQAGEILDKIGIELNRLSVDKKFPELWYLVAAVSDFCEVKAGTMQNAGERARTMLVDSARPEFLSWLIERYNSSDEDAGKALERYFDNAGKPALDAALDRLLSPEPVYFQKQLIGYVRGKGAEARPVIEAALKGQKGGQARKLIYLLGELRAPESASLLLDIAGEPDQALKREAIRALGKIKNKNVSLALAGMFRNKDLEAETKMFLVQTLGERQELLAVPSLISILKEKSETVELKEKAAEALGKIGSREALPALTAVFDKGGFFSKPAPEKLKMKAAEALSRIGGERVEYLLEDLSRGKGLLAQYCAELLTQLRTRKGK
jgi:hypothetical protein